MENKTETPTNTSEKLKTPTRKAFYRCILFTMSIAAFATNALAAPTTTTTKLPAIVASSSSSIALANAQTTTAAPQIHIAPPTTHERLRKRHAKRHSSNWYDYMNFNETSTALEWSNPCGGFYTPTADVALGTVVGLMKRKHPKQIYNILKKSANNEHKTLSSQQDIDISNIQDWFLYNSTYKFLPKLKENSSIALKRWYRNMQTYVASFAYLRRTQLKWDHLKSQRESRVARELKHLLASSRRMLCELESAVNNTHPYERRQQRALPQITRPQMNKRLKLRTRRRGERMAGGAVLDADSIDLQFVKYYYFEYLQTMWKVLRKITKRRGQTAIGEVQNKEFNEIEKSAESSSTMTTLARDAKLKRPRNRKNNNRNKNKSRMGSSRSSSSSRRAAAQQLKTQK